MPKDANVVRLAVIWEKYTRPFHRDCALKFLTEQIEDIQSESFDDTILSPSYERQELHTGGMERITI